MSKNCAENNAKTATRISSKLDTDIPHMKEGCANFFLSDPINFGDFTSENSEKLDLDDSADFVGLGKCQRFLSPYNFCKFTKKILRKFSAKTILPPNFFGPKFQLFFSFFPKFHFRPNFRKFSAKFFSEWPD